MMFLNISNQDILFIQIHRVFVKRCSSLCIFSLKDMLFCYVHHLDYCCFTTVPGGSTFSKLKLNTVSDVFYVVRYKYMQLKLEHIFRMTLYIQNSF
jgi:hypothetical protein